MRKLVSLLPLLALLAGCASYAPGDDKKGIELQSTGTQVLLALRGYIDQNARAPRSLNELVPKYLPALPDQPQIQYDPKNMRLAFVYQQEGSQGSQVECHAVSGETDWICTGVYTQKQ